jgi:hypothetical protein
MRLSSLMVTGFVVAAACGGTTTSLDGGTDAGSNDATVSDVSSKDSAPDVIDVDAASCVPPNTACTTPCPTGTYCLRASGPTSIDLGCTPVPPECNGKPTCACMADCFCPQQGVNKCIDGTTSLECDNGAISRRAFKTDISYVDDDRRADVAYQTLHTSLAEYRYKTEPKTTQRHLGFIIDDMPNASPAVESDKTHVDLYGYTSMLLATVQEQQKQIDALKAHVDALEKRR